MGRRKGSKNGTRKKEKIACKHCGKEKFFEPWQARKTSFCSLKCAYAHRKKDRICSICGKIFHSEYAKKHCSKECNSNFLKNRYNKDNPSPRQIERVESTCLSCGKKFLDTMAHARKVCSKQCADKFFQRRGKFKCSICGKEQLLRPSYIKGRKFCSRKCRTIGIGKQDTSIEKAIESLLIKHNIQYIKQFPLNNYLYDFKILDKNIVIECDGDYWHSLPKAIIRDKAKDNLINEMGWKIIRFKESTINKDISFCEKAILDTC